MCEIYDLYSRSVFGVALRLLNDQFAAEDVLHEVFLDLWVQPSKFEDNRCSLGASLLIDARHRALAIKARS